MASEPNAHHSDENDLLEPSAEEVANVEDSDEIPPADDPGNLLSGVLGGLIEQATYISKEMDTTIETLMTVQRNIEDSNIKIKQNEEKMAKLESLQNKCKSVVESFVSRIARRKTALGKKPVDDRRYSAEKRAERSSTFPEGQAEEDDAIETVTLISPTQVSVSGTALSAK